jgi:O-antigen/teichoic acid export membrane protein
LGTDSFGQYAFVLALYSYFALLANPGFDTVGTREVAKGKYSVEELFGSIFALRVLFSIASFVLLLVCSFFFYFDNAIRTLLITQGLNLLLTPLFIQFIFRGLTEMKYVSLSRILQSGLFLLFVAIFVHKAGDIFYLPVLLLCSTVASLVPLFILYRNRFGSFSFSTSVVSRRYVLHISIMVGVSSFMILIYYNLDSVILGFLRSSYEVGLYAAAYKIVLLLTTAPSVILASFFPFLSKDRKGKGYGVILRKYLTVMFVTGVPVGFIGYFAADWMVEFLFGSSFRLSSTPLRILLFNVSLVFVNMAFANPLLAWGEEKAYLKIVAGGAVTNLFFNVLLIPHYGIVGAAIATLLSEGTVFIIARREFYKRTELRFDKLLARIVFLAALSFCCCNLVIYFVKV